MSNNTKSNNTKFENIASDQLSSVSGGIGWGKIAKVTGKVVGKKFLGPVSAAWTGYDVTKAVLKAHGQHKSVGDTVKAGAKALVL